MWTCRSSTYISRISVVWAVDLNRSLITDDWLRRSAYNPILDARQWRQQMSHGFALYSFLFKALKFWTQLPSFEQCCIEWASAKTRRAIIVWEYSRVCGPNTYPTLTVISSGNRYECNVGLVADNTWLLSGRIKILTLYSAIHRRLK